MAQHDYIIANQSGAAFRSDLNNGLAAIVSQNSGAAQPSTTYAYQWWADTTTGLLKLRNAANNAWITIGTLADANLGLLSLAGGTLTGALLADDSGTAALPAIAFDGDTNTGIFSPGADQFGIATNGVERVEFGNTEVVFNDGGADVDFRVEGDTNANLFKIDAGLDQVQVANLNGGPLAGFRNRIINGNFDIWQRGTSFSSPVAGTYTADRWVVNYDGSGATQTISQNTFIPGSTEAAPGATFFLGFTQTVAGSGATFNVLLQRIESVRTFGGQTVTLSFYARGVSVALTLPSITLTQDFGAGGSATVFTNVAASVVIAATNFAKYTYTVTLPSITGKTIGTSSYLALEFALPINATFDFQVGSVQLEPGSVATPFEQRPIGTELALCQRYYQHTTRVNLGGITSSGIGLYGAVQLPVVMRADPTASQRSQSLVGSVTAITLTVLNAHYVDFVLDNTSGGSGIGSAVYALSAEL